MSQATPKYPNRLREQIKRLGYTQREVAEEQLNHLQLHMERGGV